ncbi:MAG: polysaccharide biosynthesis C-terminal domain-containing protein, partial [Actinomycetota bacterium]|nr:polysaccharide biosynthesis C-terminal domain-containing protein [Actinomycetota bacterium]
GDARRRAITSALSKLGRRTPPEPSADDGSRDARRDLTSLASGWLLTLLGVVVSGVSGFAFSVVIARGLGAHGAGVFVTSAALFVIALSAAQLGAPSAVVRMLARFVALDRARDIRPLLAIALAPPLVVSVALAVGVFVFAPELAHGLLDDGEANDAVPYLRAFAVFLPLFVAYETVISATRGLGTMLPVVAIGQLGIAPARPLLSLGVFALGLGGVVLVVAWSVPVVIGLVVAVWVLARLIRRAESGSEVERDPDGGEGRAPALASEFWRFTLPLGAATILQIVLLWLDTVLLAALASPREAGIYKTAASFVTQGTFAQQAIILVIGPLLSALLARAEYGRAQAVYRTATWWITALAWPMYITLAVFAPLLMTLFGPEFVAGSEPLRILSITMLVAMATGPVTAALVMSGRSSWNLFNTVLAVGSNVILNLMLIPPFGMTGAALAWAVSILIGNLAPLAQVWTFMRLNPFGSGFPIVAVGATACYGVVGLVGVSALGMEVVGLLASGVVGSALYLLFLWRFREALQLRFLRESLHMRRVGRRPEAV